MWSSMTALIVWPWMPPWRLLWLCACSVVSDCDNMNHSPPGGSSVHGILQARMLEWVAISYSRGSSWPRDWTLCLFRLLHWQVGSLPVASPGKPILLICYTEKFNQKKKVEARWVARTLISLKDSYKQAWQVFSVFLCCLLNRYEFLV